MRIFLPGRSSSTPPRRGRATAWTRWTLVAAFFTAVIVVSSYPLAFTPGSRIGHHGDALFSVWRLAWVAHQLRTDPRHLFDANIFYPERGTLAFSDAMLLPAVILAPVNWAGADPLIVYNLALLCAFVLNAMAACLLVSRLTGSTPAGVLGGLIFAFAPFRFDHFDHLEMQLSFWMPLAVLAWHRAVTRERIGDYLRVSAFAACQALSCIYYGIFLLTWLAGVTAVWFIRTPLTALKAGAWTLLPAIMVLGIYSLPYVRNHDRLGDRPLRDVKSWSAEASDFLSAPGSSILYGATDSLAVPERHLLPGLTAGAFLIVGLWPPWDRVRAVHAAGLAVALQLALGFNSVLYPLLYRWVLPYRGLRVPARATILILLGISVLAGFGLARLLVHVGRRSLAAMVVGAVIVVASVEYLSRPPLKPVDAQVSAWYGTLRSIPDAVVFEWPVSVPWRLHEMVDVMYMYRSTLHWRPMLNGYSGHYPSSYVEFLLEMRSFPDAGSLQLLQRAGATVLIVHEVFGSRPSYEYAIDRLARDPSVSVLARDQDAGARVTFFRLNRPSPATR